MVGEKSGLDGFGTLNGILQSEGNGVFYDADRVAGRETAALARADDFVLVSSADIGRNALAAVFQPTTNQMMGDGETGSALRADSPPRQHSDSARVAALIFPVGSHPRLDVVPERFGD